MEENNKSYTQKSRPYMELHKKQIEDLRDKMKENIPCSLRKYYYTCECGARVGFHTFRFHQATQKHRKVCGDLPLPPDDSKE